ncbi:phosphoribosylaminoimidazole carboxylase, catalytic subunit [Thermosinus carboxydivorans Nor1]|uniref:N5-carboxyaminoimidazole ribonucleotide mutase n=1 Tax=Thermosinus carboxydivorans Nor1 TaxID=401526 RepID=A1HSV9_9FIRM|nr:5-(carboxyamino)imidazole ribonucleotide mutase [Thermosinus carboxydivorans]EAX46903.1 phosphoribosylaminoimidazole carboxylase, catalytic subunit [Thermosinus carboxydivorans Nor1]
MKVAIIMGSDSDLPILRPALETLQDFGIDTEVVIASAHRTPHKVHEFAATAEKRGVKVIIAAAGAAAHLPGVVASFTTLPVIGVPVNSTSLGGLDALLSIVQMPSGIPVATMAINGAKNAAIFAAQIIATGNAALAAKLAAYRQKMAAEVEQKAARAQEKLQAN